VWKPSRVAALLDGCVTGLAFYYLTSVIVVVAAVFAVDFVPLCRQHPESKTRVDLVSGFAAWDGMWYGRIASTGYSYDPHRQSAVAFFPLYPMLAAAIVQATGIRTEWALLAVSHGALVATFCLVGTYVQRRDSAPNDHLQGWTLLAFGLFPTTFYFRMAYTESLFVMLMLIALLGMERGWRPVWIAFVIGLATGTRSVGVALVPAFALHLWQRVNSWWSWSARLGALLPVCCWGLLAYMVFLWLAFDEPLAFIKTQAHWRVRAVGVADRTIGLATLEPVRTLYEPSCPCYWGHAPPRENILFNLKAVTPIYFFGTAVLVGVGAYRRWLNGREVLLSVGLLLIPYCLHASPTCMGSHARYAASVFPAYLVLGQLLHRMPAPLSAALLALSGLFLGLYSAMFVSWYWFY
jgi:hypothetical protein